jgi:hypothetical protein
VWLITAQPAATAKPPVRWSLTSEPSGATVSRADDGKILGRTPWVQEQPTAAGEIKVRISKSDYKAQEILLHRGRSQNTNVRLERDIAFATEETTFDKAGATTKPKTPSGPGGKTPKPVKPGPSTPSSGKPPTNADTRVKVVDD